MVTGNLLGVFEGPEMLIILAVVLLLFGGAKLPGLARSMGQAKKEFLAGQAEPALRPDPEAIGSEAMVTVSRAELDRLRKANGN